MKNAKRINIIGDENADKNYLHRLLGGLQDLEDLSCLNVQIYWFAPAKIYIQSFILPSNRDLKTYNQLYFNMHSKPDLIIYVIDKDSSQRQIKQWLNMIGLIDEDLRICFFSDAQTYVQRQHIFSKISPLFYRDITEHIFFPNIDSSSIITCLCNIGDVGIFLMHYAKKIPTISRVKQIWSKITHRNNKNQQII